MPSHQDRSHHESPRTRSKSCPRACLTSGCFRDDVDFFVSCHRFQNQDECLAFLSAQVAVVWTTKKSGPTPWVLQLVSIPCVIYRRSKRGPVPSQRTLSTRTSRAKRDSHKRNPHCRPIHAVEHRIKVARAATGVSGMLAWIAASCLTCARETARREKTIPATIVCNG